MQLGRKARLQWALFCLLGKGLLLRADFTVNVFANQIAKSKGRLIGELVVHTGAPVGSSN